MIEIINDEIYSIPLTENAVRQVVKLDIGDKLYPAINTEETCNVLASTLNKIGYSTNIGQNMYTNEWSIAIVDKIPIGKR